MGDAAHTMSPILGQGLNCGLEDVAVFADVLQGHEGNVDTALPEYTAARWPDVEAMLNINEIIARSDYTLTTKVAPCFSTAHADMEMASIAQQTLPMVMSCHSHDGHQAGSEPGMLQWLSCCCATRQAYAKAQICCCHCVQACTA